MSIWSGFEAIVTTSTLVDTNILIDVLGPASPHRDWSLGALEQCINNGFLVVNPVIWAGLASSPLSEIELVSVLAWLALRRETVPFDAAFAAGKAHRRYRLGGGQRDHTLPDFFIGAHAQFGKHQLLTRDSARYSSYFPWSNWFVRRRSLESNSA